MKLTVVTPTGARPEAFMLCQLWMSRQTLQPHQWIVMDDCDPPTACIAGQEYFYCPEFRGRMSLLNKISLVCSSGGVTGDGLVFIEDDDWYSPKWLQFCSDQLEQYDMVGEGRAIYYNVRYRYWFGFPNMGNSSLCSTAVRTTQLGKVAELCIIKGNQDPFLDQRIWIDGGGIKCNKRVFEPVGGRLVIGIKGMPGRAGYNVGHGYQSDGAQYDWNLEKLRSLIGNDAELYKPFYND